MAEIDRELSNERIDELIEMEEEFFANNDSRNTEYFANHTDSRNTEYFANHTDSRNTEYFANHTDSRNTEYFAKITSEGSLMGILLDFESFVRNSTDDNPLMNLMRRDFGIEEVTKKSRLGKYKRIKGNDQLLNESCSICLEKYEVGKYKRDLKCKHVFHKKCIDKWIIKKDNNNCPVCRKFVY